MAKCRDCSRCTQSSAQWLLLLPFRAVFETIARFTVWPFMKICPVCGHPLAWHKRDSAGRFAD